MLARVLEPEVMDTEEDAETYDAMDHCQVNAAFVADLLASDELSGSVLDLGTGTALIPLELCRRHPDVRVVAVDMADSMLERAQLHIESAGLADRITLDRCDAKDLPYPADRFDAVISNSIIHHLARPELALEQALRVTRAGGRLFFRDLARPTTELELRRLVEQYAGSEPLFAQSLFANSLRAALTVTEMQA